MKGKHNEKSCTTTCFKYNNDVTNDPDHISNTFYNIFTDVDPNYANAIPAPKKQFTRYLQNTPAKNKKSSGHDNLSPHLFKLLCEQISLPIDILINKLVKALYPMKLKLQKSIPVYK